MSQARPWTRGGPPFSRRPGLVDIGINLGPMRTPFQPAAGCLAEIHGIETTQAVTTATVTTSESTVTSTSLTRAKWHSLGHPLSNDCYPSSFAAVSTLYYSPAVCPLGWSTARVQVDNSQDAPETRVACCPGDYKYTEATEPWLATVACVSSAVFPNDKVTATVPVIVNGKSSVATLVSATVHAAPVHVRFQDGDFNSISSSSLVTSPAAGQTSDSPPPPPHADPFPQSARIGVAVGCTVAALLAIGALIFFWLRRRRQHRAATAVGSSPVTDSPVAAFNNDRESIVATMSDVGGTPLGFGGSEARSEFGIDHRSEMGTDCRSDKVSGRPWADHVVAFYDDNQKYVSWRHSPSKKAEAPAELPSPESVPVYEAAWGRSATPVHFQPLDGGTKTELFADGNRHEMQAAAVPRELP